MDTARVTDHITHWLKAYCLENRQQGFVIGISGGIDSAVTSALCARTGLPLLCVEMPIHQAANQVSRGQEHIGWLKERHPLVGNAVVDLTTTFDTMVAALPTNSNTEVIELARANTRARLRMTALYYLAGLHGYLVAGTGNKVEDFGVGFFTKYGDGGVDLSPISDLTKTEVYELAKELGVVQSIQVAAPTDGLFGDSRTDADQIGATYPELEWAMAFREKKSSGTSLTPRQTEVLAIFDRRHAANRHKMVPIPVCTIPAEYR